MKKILKAMLKFLNDYSVTAFCKVHFRKQARKYCKKRHIGKIDREYSKSIKKYWKQYGVNISTVFHRYYTGVNGIKDESYIPEDFFYDKIERYFNDISIEKAYSDKSMYGRLFPSVKQPTTIIINANGIYYDEKYNIISDDEACSRLMQEEQFVIKPTRNSGGGKNVKFIQSHLTKEMVHKLVKQYKTDFIVQVPLEQHDALAAVHQESINTVRIMSLMIDGNVEIVGSVIRMGVGDSKLDNLCSGGLSCGLDQNGHFRSFAYDDFGRKYDTHPQGFEFAQGYVPSYDKLIELVKREHRNLPYFGLVSWDLMVDKIGDPVMIEINLRWCGNDFYQFYNGGLFGDRTDEILRMVLGGKNTRGGKK